MKRKKTKALEVPKPTKKDADQEIEQKVKDFIDPKKESPNNKIKEESKEAFRKLATAIGKSVHKTKLIAYSAKHKTAALFHQKKVHIPESNFSSTKNIDFTKEQIRKMAQTTLKAIAKQKKKPKLPKA